MTTRGITFLDAGAPVATEPLRLDAALAVGLAAPRPGALPPDLVRHLAASGRGGVVRGENLIGIPLPIASWAGFCELFLPTRGIVGRDAGHTCVTPLAAAVRAFFAHGGRDLTVIALGAPPAAGADEATRIRALELVISGATHRWDAATDRGQLLNTWLPAVCADVVDQASWHGIAHLEGLPAPALVLLPDLPELTAAGMPPLEAMTIAGDPSVTICCAPAASAQARPLVGAPRHDEVGFTLWVRLVNHLASWIALRHRTAQLVLAAPLAVSQLPARRDPLRYLAALGCDRRLDAGGLASAFVVLGGGWLSGALADDLPGGLLPADGALAGLLATNARGRGAWRSTTGMALRASGVEPMDGLSVRNQLATRLCLVESTPGGLRLGSDVTTSDDPAWRPGMVCRLLALVLRTAQRSGEEMVFAPSGEAAWRGLAQRIDDVLDLLARRGALAAGGGEDAYTVSCNRTTMTQADIDGGRLIARIVLRPAVPVEAIDVLLASEGGALAVVGGAT